MIILEEDEPKKKNEQLERSSVVVERADRRLAYD